jgi:hypothetical protein
MVKLCMQMQSKNYFHYKIDLSMKPLQHLSVTALNNPSSASYDKDLSKLKTGQYTHPNSLITHTLYSWPYNLSNFTLKSLKFVMD